MVYLDYFKAEFKRSFFVYFTIIVIYLIVCLFSKTMPNIAIILSTIIVGMIGVLIKAFRNYRKKETIKGPFDWS
ncbi:hypothetical protein KAH94_05895 [bacterium]|nr:hypothetical protein [bacterium]